MRSLESFKERFLYPITDRLPKNIERARRLDEAIEKVKRGDSLNDATMGLSRDEVEAVRAAVWVSNLPGANSSPSAIKRGKRVFLEEIARKAKSG
jgi:hypothetical protein